MLGKSVVYLLVQFQIVRYLERGSVGLGRDGKVVAVFEGVVVSDFGVFEQEGFHVCAYGAVVPVI